jgi:KDO2-lipid IV(A) lauroyltransferase
LRAPTFRDRIEYVLFRGAVALCAALPLGVSLALGRRLGDLAFDLIQIRRRVALENLALIEPDPARRRALARAVYRNLGETFVEFARLTVESVEDLWGRLTIEGEEGFFEAARRGHGAVLTSAHFGSWEIFGAAVAARGHPVTYVVADQRNPLVGSFIDRRRQRMGVRTYPVGKSARRALRELRENRFIVLLADQDAGRDGLFLPFLGRSASVATGPALVAQRSGALVVPGFIVRQGGGRHHMVIGEPFTVGPGSEGMAEAARRYTALIESYVRRHPDHWFWVHRRWKSRPESEQR